MKQRVCSDRMRIRSQRLRNCEIVTVVTIIEVSTLEHVRTRVQCLHSSQKEHAPLNSERQRNSFYPKEFSPLLLLTIFMNSCKCVSMLDLKGILFPHKNLCSVPRFLFIYFYKRRNLDTYIMFECVFVSVCIHTELSPDGFWLSMCVTVKPKYWLRYERSIAEHCRERLISTQACWWLCLCLSMWSWDWFLFTMQYKAVEVWKA